MTSTDIRRAQAEHRWPAVVALFIALGLYASLPNSVLPPGLRYSIVAVGLALVVPVLFLNPHHLTRQTTWSRYASVGQALLLMLANQVALVQLVMLMVGLPPQNGSSLLASALQVWVTNVIAFALVYWELDRGGPVDRRHQIRSELPFADFRFPQDEDEDAVEEVAARSSVRLDWTPSFVDYLYFSGTNSMAFSPTDTMPLSHRAKALMLAESFGGFVMLALVIAHAVAQFG